MRNPKGNVINKTRQAPHLRRGTQINYKTALCHSFKNQSRKKKNKRDGEFIRKPLLFLSKAGKTISQVHRL